MNVSEWHSQCFLASVTENQHIGPKDKDRECFIRSMVQLTSWVSLARRELALGEPAPWALVNNFASRMFWRNRIFLQEFWLALHAIPIIACFACLNLPVYFSVYFVWHWNIKFHSQNKKCFILEREFDRKKRKIL